jgi:hypothetical protein
LPFLALFVGGYNWAGVGYGDAPKEKLPRFDYDVLGYKGRSVCVDPLI